MSQDQSANPRQTLKLEIELELQPGQQVELSVQAAAQPAQPVTLQPAQPAVQSVSAEDEVYRLLEGAGVQAGEAESASAAAWARGRLARAEAWLGRLPDMGMQGVFLLVLGLYLLSRFAGIQSFPIYFAGDEAVTAMRAADLVRDGFRDYDGRFLPTFFLNDGKLSLGTTVYLQLIPNTLVGQQVWATRGINALVCLLGVYFFGLILRDIFKARWWPLGALLFAGLPAWFLFTRTAYETALMVSFYTAALYAYLRYRQGSPRWLYAAVGFAALAFYTYVPGQVIVTASAALLAGLDFRHHWQNGRTVLRALGLVGLAALPFLRYLIVNAGQYPLYLSLYRSTVTADLTPWQRLLSFLANYLEALNPLRWFLPYQESWKQYLMGPYGHLPFFLAPLLLIGLSLLIRNGRQPEWRALAVPLLVTPLVGGLVGVEVTRVLTLVLPFGLLASLGLFAALEWLGKRLRWAQEKLALGAGQLLGLYLVVLLASALIGGPTWITDYGLSGMQYGARQVFGSARAYAEAHPQTRIYVAGEWTWQDDTVLRYFIPETMNIHLGSPRDHLEELANQEDLRFFLKQNDYQELLADPIYTSIQVEETIYYPDGSPAFLLTRLNLSPEARQQILSGAAPLNQPVETRFEWQGQTVQVRHSALDGGEIASVMDENPASLVRTRTDNPFFIEFTFSQPPELNGLEILMGSEEARLSAQVTPVDGEAQTFWVTAPEGTDLKTVRLDFPSVLRVCTLRVELLDVFAPQQSNVHLWDLRFLQP